MYISINIYIYFFKSSGLSSSPTTLYDRYSSPTANPTRRRLFVDNDNTSDNGTPVRVPQQPVVNTVPVQNMNPEAMSVTPVPGQTLVTVATATVTANNGQTVTIPVQGKGKATLGLGWFSSEYLYTDEYIMENSMPVVKEQV